MAARLQATPQGNQPCGSLRCGGMVQGRLTYYITVSLAKFAGFAPKSRKLILMWRILHADQRHCRLRALGSRRLTGRNCTGATFRLACASLCAALRRLTWCLRAKYRRIASRYGLISVLIASNKSRASLRMLASSSATISLAVDMQSLLSVVAVVGVGLRV